MKNIMKPGGIAVGLGLMLTALCQAQQWSGVQNLGGSIDSTPFAAEIPGTNLVQVFYQGTDHALWTRWRKPDGSWSNEQNLGGQLYFGDGYNSLANPIAIQIPGTNILQVFYRGADQALWSLWRNPDGSWSNLQRLGGQLNGDPAVVQVPGTNQIEVFYQGLDHGMYTRWLDNGTWSIEVGMGGQLFASTCNDETNGSCFGANATPVPIQIPNTGYLEVFYRGSDNTLRARLRDIYGDWGPELDLEGNLSSDPSAAPVPGTDQIQVFYRGGGGCTQFAAPGAPPVWCESSGGSVMTQWGNLDFWQGERQMAGKTLGYYCASDATVDGGGWNCIQVQGSYSVPKAYVQPGTNNLWLIYRGEDPPPNNGGFWPNAQLLWTQERTADGTWQPEYTLSVRASSDVNGVQIPNTNEMQFFFRGDIFAYEDVGNLMTQWYPN
jgi:hypothetical protein